jgi:hypothetical protein
MCKSPHKDVHQEPFAANDQIVGTCGERHSHCSESAGIASMATYVTELWRQRSKSVTTTDDIQCYAVDNLFHNRKQLSLPNSKALHLCTVTNSVVFEKNHVADSACRIAHIMVYKQCSYCCRQVAVFGILGHPPSDIAGAEQAQTGDEGISSQLLVRYAHTVLNLESLVVWIKQSSSLVQAVSEICFFDPFACEPFHDLSYQPTHGATLAKDVGDGPCQIHALGCDIAGRHLRNGDKAMFSLCVGLELCASAAWEEKHPG